MKNRYVSLLAVALFSTVFAAGCGKFTKCGDAKSEPDCKDAKKFEEGKHTCEWKQDKADPKKGTCESNWKAKDAAKAHCEGVNSDAETDMSKRQSKCESDAKAAATKEDPTATCKWADNKCNVVQK